MSDRYPGGMITKTPVVPAGPYEDGAAPGIWTLEQQAYYKAQGLWPLAGNPQPDPYYEAVTLLLPGNGTNGGQNNTFLDGSTNAYSITRNGNTTQGSFNPYGSNWSNYFITANTTTNNPSVDFSPSTVTLSGDFTLECWISPISYATGGSNHNDYPTAWHIRNNSNQGVLLGQFGAYGTGAASTFTFMIRDSGEQYFATATIPLGQWTHLAVVRSGTTATAYVNGTSVGSRSSTESWTLSTCGIGAYTGSLRGYYGFNGAISNFRLTTTAVYTSAFTPPTSPLTAISGTQLLTCQSNKFVDNSTNAFAPTIYGNTGPRIRVFSPFNPTASYSTATLGGSGYFDGTGDSLNTGTTGVDDTLTGDFTIEAWVYPTAWGNYQRIIGGGVGAAVVDWAVGFSTTWDGNLKVNWVVPGTDLFSTAYPNTGKNQWFHVAVVRTGSTLYYYINGTRYGTSTYSGTPGSANGGFTIGDRSDADEYWYGYISNVRVVVGTNVYGTGATCTVPTAPLTAISGTKLLLNTANASVVDYAMMNDVETVGTAQISTAQSKFGGGSISFDGTGDWLNIHPNPTFRLGASTFTWEWWEYRTAISGRAYVLMGGGAAATYDPIIGKCQSSGTQNVVFMSSNGSGWDILSNFNLGSCDLNTWNHFALVRQGSNFYGYKNGVLTSSTTSSAVVYQSDESWTIGHAQFNDNPNEEFQGYVDDMRLTIGVARYPSGTTFTPPTKAFPTY